MATRLIITADDYGYSPAYDAGILAAARAGAIDAISVMACRRGIDPSPLTDLEQAIGLHLEPTAGGGLDRASVTAQIERFEALLGRPPDHLDGHRHCHAAAAAADSVARIAAERDLPVRSVGAAHRRLLRDAGVRTPDLLIGRFEESGPPLPPQLDPGPAPPGWIEWMTHPGNPDPGTGSSYDRGRGEDLAVLLSLRLPRGIGRSDQRRLPVAG